MIHASTIPVDYYLAAVRPTMQPPEVATPLSGRQHRGYKTFRAAMKDLLKAVPDTYEQLVARDSELAYARDALLEADLIDSERHVTLAYSMVQLRRSIAQTPTGPDNAVGELRLMRHRRAAQYAPLIRCAVSGMRGRYCQPKLVPARAGRYRTVIGAAAELGNRNRSPNPQPSDRHGIL
ncbi:hypothetical protein ACLMAJ_31880 [Nocardia sp. KC 131]|uniref:hypothetical protein n=1 Tax=Nocardia arseniciresistens TaxID=3392119 RepID=UPI00398ED6BF